MCVYCLASLQHLILLEVKDIASGYKAIEHLSEA